LNKKFLSPNAYWTKLKRLIAGAILHLGIPIEVKVNVGGHEIKFVARSYLEYFLRAQEGYKREPLTTRWVSEYIRKDDIVYDVGANVGTFSLLMAKVVAQGQGMVYAFEPESNNFSSLNQNIFRNNLTENIMPLPIACADQTRVANFYLSSVTSGAALHGIDRPESEGCKFVPQHIQGVFVSSLDELVFKFGLPTPSHIKIDVDGAEKMVVMGMKRLMALGQLSSVLIEIDADGDAEIVQSQFLSAGFEEVSREQWPGKNVFNVLFCNKSQSN